MRLAVLFVLVLCGALGWGCAARPQAVDARVEPGLYTAAFESAKDVLRGYDFSLDRVDAASGVITTLPKRTAGAATPWDREQSSLGQEFEDLLDRQSRVARVDFVPAGVAGRAGNLPGSAGWQDLRSTPQPLAIRVSVQVSRRQRPGWRLESTSIRSSTRASDPALQRAGLEPAHDQEMGEDAALAERITREIAERVGVMAPASTGASAGANLDGADSGGR